MIEIKICFVLPSCGIKTSTYSSSAYIEINLNSNYPINMDDYLSFAVFLYFDVHVNVNISCRRKL